MGDGYYGFFYIGNSNGDKSKRDINGLAYEIVGPVERIAMSFDLGSLYWPYKEGILSIPLLGRNGKELEEIIEKKDSEKIKDLAKKIYRGHLPV